MFYAGDKVPDIKNNPLLKLLGKILRITPQLHGQKFFVTLTDEKSLYKRAIYCTPLFVALVMIEFADIIFAVDSVPAIFVITTDAYIVYTSNIFAILGLRALYFALAAVLYRFSYLKQAMAAILVFIGSKIFIADLLGLEKFPASLSLGVTMGLLAWGVGYSMYRTKKV